MYDRSFFENFQEDNEYYISEDNNYCEHNFKPLEAYFTCINCGLVDIDRQIFVDHKIHYNNYGSCYLYHRRTYFKIKLRLLSGYKQCLSEKYQDALNKLKCHKFQTIAELRKLMKKLKLQRFYNYIYSIYYDIKKVRLINLSLDDIEFLLNKFQLFEKEFKKQFPEKSNILSYNLTIYLLLKKYKYDCYKYILLPKNKIKFIDKIINLISE
jgi:hypothetical protein